MPVKEKTVLKIFIKKQWFDEIISKQKTIEYRDVSPFWISRLYDTERKKRNYDQIEFINGMQTNARRVITNYEGVKKKGDMFLIGIGRILKKNF